MRKIGFNHQSASVITVESFSKNNKLDAVRLNIDLTVVHVVSTDVRFLLCLAEFEPTGIEKDPQDHIKPLLLVNHRNIGWLSIIIMSASSIDDPVLKGSYSNESGTSMFRSD